MTKIIRIKPNRIMYDWWFSAIAMYTMFIILKSLVFPTLYVWYKIKQNLLCPGSTFYTLCDNDLFCLQETTATPIYLDREILCVDVFFFPCFCILYNLCNIRKFPFEWHSNFQYLLYMCNTIILELSLHILPYFEKGASCLSCVSC